MSSMFRILVALGFIAFMSSPSFAQATRTWVSGVGDDVNPCSRTAPCKTFAGAISKTAAGGEINCLDPGGFGAVTITKSITIDCTGTLGSILNSGTNGIIINDSATAAPNTIEVILRGITIDGAGFSAGINGIRFLAGRSLVVQDVLIQNETGGSGILLEPSALIEFYAEDVTATDGFRGILIQPTGANGAVRAVLRNVRAQNNSGVGLGLNMPSTTAAAGTTVVADKSSFSGNGSGALVTAPAGTSSGTLMVTDSVITMNSVAGVSASGTNARIRIANSSVTGNVTGVSIASGAIVNSYGTNRLDRNGTNGTFTAPVIPQQ